MLRNIFCQTDFISSHLNIFSQPKPYKISDFSDLSSRISFGSFDRNSVMVPQGLISVLLILANIVLDYAQESKIIPVSTQAFNACFFLLSILFLKKVKVYKNLLFNFASNVHCFFSFFNKKNPQKTVNHNNLFVGFFHKCTLLNIFDNQKQITLYLFHADGNSK